MANDFFKFKQFTVYQDACGMKICTDSCILGAYVAVNHSTKILDIGTGTGLLALMMAQRSDANIDAVEIDESAYAQALTNVKNSPFKDKIRVFHQAIQYFAAQYPENQYDLIVSNPPFFQNHLPSTQKQKQVALHNEALSLEDLLIAVQKLLTKKGYFTIMLPPYESEKLKKLATQYDLFVCDTLLIFNHIAKPLFRMIQTFSFQKQETKVQELFIKDEKGVYSSDFAALLKDYYLIF